MADAPRSLPHCAYPRAADTARHGVQALPATLPRVDFIGAQPYRSQRHAAVHAADLESDKILQMAEVVGNAFSRREPQIRHVHPSRHPPAGLMQARHTDPFGTDEVFGRWTKTRLLYWFIRLFILTDPTSPRTAIRRNDDALTCSLAILNPTGEIIGGAFNETMPRHALLAFRQNDPFLSAVWSFLAPFFDLLGAQDTEALGALSEHYPDFDAAHAEGKVGHHFLVARSGLLAKADTFELVAASAAHFEALGYRYMVVEASNPWAGAACEALGAVRVHFAPYQARLRLLRSPEPLDGIVTSSSGWLSDKDSGIMFYAMRLA